jgi:hypothetical protein
MPSLSRPKTAAALLGGLVGAVLLVLALLGGRDDKQESVGLQRRLQALRSVPYTAVTPREVASDLAGVVLYDGEQAWPGYNIYVDRSTSSVVLMDMDGTAVHRWTYPDEKVRYWDHAIMLANGDALVIRKFYDVLRLDWNSKLVWRSPVEAQHEITPLPDGSLLVVARELHKHRGLTVRFPAIVRLDDKGREIARWSTYDRLEEIKEKFDGRYFIDTILDSLIEKGVDPQTWEPLTAEAESAKAGLDARPLRYDQFHMNTISMIPANPLGRLDKRFEAGNMLICFRNINQIAVISGETGEVLWVWGAGELDGPHHPTMVENGNILIFDNGVRRKYSRLIEVNPRTERIEWEYVGDPPESFFSPEKSSAQRLPNGNTLVCEGDRGRCFEITRDGEIVWEWYNPAMLGRHRVQVYRMMRLQPGVVEALLSHERSEG